MIRLAELGAHVMMSNSKSRECKKLFNSPHFEITEIPVTRTIQRKKESKIINTKKIKRNYLLHHVFKSC